MATVLAHDIVRFLGLGGDPAGPKVLRASSREWERTIRWLDHSGLALYFLERVEADGATPCIPADILCELKERRKKNEQRVECLKAMFASINDGFDRNRVRFAVLKGFSLTPEYCANPCNRAQSDFDYLIAKDSSAAAQNALTEQGYVLKEHLGEELSFWIPTSEPTDAAQQYSPNGPWMVELHSSTWDQSLWRVPLRIPEPSFTDLRTHRWSGLEFPCLPKTWAFVAQILHCFKHVLDGWIRLSWLFEIACFLRDQGDDALLWREIDQVVSAEPLVGELVAAITCLAIDLFEPAVPEPLQKYIQDLQPTVRVWLEEYAPGWLFEKFPRYEICFFSRSKRSMFLRELYCAPQADHGRQFFGLLFPLRGMKRQVQKRHVQTTTMHAIAHKTRWLASHSIYHAGATLRYLWELPRWRHRMQLLRAHGEVRNTPNSPS
jgi:hypothetical protein